MCFDLATSFTLLFIACLLCLSDLNGGGGTYRARLMVVILAVFVLMSLIRVEKLYLATFLFVICLGSHALGWWRQHGRIEPRLTIALCLVLICGTGSVVAVKKLTTTVDYDRPPLDLPSIAFNRVVWPHLAAVYPKLPDDAKRLFSFEDAVWFDSHANNVYPLLSRLLSSGSDGKHVVNEITYTTLRVMPVTVVGRTFWDFIKYAISPVIFPLELVNVLKQSTATAWTLSRMAMFHPTLTRLALLLTYGAFFLLGLPLTVLAVARTSCNDLRRSLSALFIVIAAILGNAGLFAIFAGMDAHIRYALPGYTMLVALAGLANLVWARKMIQASE